MLRRVLPNYRPLEIRLGLYSLVLIGLYTIGLAYNDFKFELNPGWLAVMLALRAVIFIVCLALLLVYLGGRGHRIYQGLLWLLLTAILAIELASLLTRPPDYLFYIIPSFLTIAYSYFLLPAPLPQKFGFPLSLSLMHIFFVLFVKEFPQPARLTLPLTLLMLNGCGIAASLILRRLREVEARYQTRLREEQRFKGLLADAAFDGLLLFEGQTILDWNQAFLEMSDYGAGEIGPLGVQDILELGDKSLDRLLNGDQIDGQLRGKLALLPVEITGRRITQDGRPVNVLCLRDRSTAVLPEQAAADNFDRRIDCLALSKREKQVVRCLINGHSRALLAQELYISDETAKKHIKNIYRKLDVSSRVELLRLVVGG